MLAQGRAGLLPVPSSQPISLRVHRRGDWDEAFPKRALRRAHPQGHGKLTLYFCDLEKQPFLKCAILGAHLPRPGPYPVSTHTTRKMIQHLIRGFPPTSVLQGVPGSQRCADPDPSLGLELGAQETLTSNC